MNGMRDYVGKEILLLLLFPIQKGQTLFTL